MGCTPSVRPISIGDIRYQSQSFTNEGESHLEISEKSDLDEDGKEDNKNDEIGAGSRLRKKKRSSHTIVDKTIDTSLQYLKLCTDYSTDGERLDTIEKLALASKIAIAIKELAIASKIVRSINNETRSELSKQLIMIEFADIFVKMFKSLQDDSYSHGDHREDCLMFLNATCINFTNGPYFNAVKLELVQQGAIELLLKELDGINQVTTDNDLIRIIDSLSILSNCVNCPDSIVRTTYRKVQAVPILMKYLKSQEMMVKMKSLSILSCIVNEEESDILASTEGCIEHLVEMLNKALNDDDYRVHYKIAGKSYFDGVYGLIGTMNRLAVNDSNKKEIVHHGGIAVITKMIRDTRMTKEMLQLAIETLWKLAFFKNHVQKITSHLQDSNTVKTIEKLRESSEDKELQTTSTGLLWELGLIEINANVKQDKPLDPPPSYEATINQGHVMLSYSWYHQEQVKKIKDILEKVGYRVWMDVGNIEHNVLESMAKAVEESAVVLVCISQKYKDSVNCQKEATYAYKKKKAIIPLILEENYEADGWLGILVCDLLYYEVYSDEKLLGQMPAVIKALGSRGRISKLQKD